MKSRAVQVIGRLHRHRAWVNAQLLEAAARLGQDELHRTLAIGQGSIWRSLTHMFAAEFVWLEALLGNPKAIAPGDIAGKLPGNQEGPDALNSLGALKQQWTALEARWKKYLDTLQDEQLDVMVPKASSRDGQVRALRQSDILLHVCTHAHYTAAQVVNMLRQVGASPLPDPMLISLAREETT